LEEIVHKFWRLRRGSMHMRGEREKAIDIDRLNELLHSEVHM
jgi:hypothetical protein